MIDGLLTVVSCVDDGQITIKGHADREDLWGTMAASVLLSVAERKPKETRAEYIDSICGVVKCLLQKKDDIEKTMRAFVTKEEKEVTPDDVQGETRVPEETEGDPEA